MKVEEYLRPVADHVIAKTIGDQITKGAVELNEVREAWSKYEMMKAWGKPESELQELLRAVQDEAGDVMVVMSGLINKTGGCLNTVLARVYEKNNRRGYYGQTK